MHAVMDSDGWTPRGKLFCFKNSLTRVSTTVTVQYSAAELQDVSLWQRKKLLMHNTIHPTMNGEWLHTKKKKKKGKLQGNYCIVNWEPESSEDKALSLEGKKISAHKTHKEADNPFSSDCCSPAKLCWQPAYLKRLQFQNNVSPD